MATKKIDPANPVPLPREPGDPEGFDAFLDEGLCAGCGFRMDAEFYVHLCPRRADDSLQCCRRASKASAVFRKRSVYGNEED